MPDAAAAEEHLRVIRSLMERATVYRAISARGALWAGLLTLACAALTWQRVPPLWFAWPWVSLLLVMLAGNYLALRREARRRQQSFPSPAARAALRQLRPAIIVAILAPTLHLSPLVAVVVWLLAYGFGLLATAHFAPASIARLGWFFLAAATAPLLLVATSHPGNLFAEAATGTFLMAITFGLFHLVYALCVWPRRPEAQP